MYTRSPSLGHVMTPSPVASPSLQKFETPPPRRNLAASDSRFAPNSFQYNGRVAIALLPCVLVLLGAGGTPVIGTLVVGLTLSYILDALQYKNGAFLGVWGSLLATAIAIALSGVGFSARSPVALSILMLLTSMHVVFLCGVWVSLQFKWLQLEQPAVVLALERILFACCPLTAAVVQTWGVIAAVGIANSPFYLMPILFTLYWMFALPLPSSFRSKGVGGGGDLETVTGPLEACIHSLVLLFLPLTFHFAIHHSMILHSINEICDHLILFFLPLLFQLFASTRGALWWLFKDPRQLRQVRLVNGIVAMCVVLGCLEIRVIFHSFAHYIHLPVPLNYLLVTVAVYGGGLGTAGHVMGLLKGTGAGRYGVITMLLAAAVSASLVLGMPWQILPAPALAAVYLAHFLSSGSIVSYLIFMTATGLSAAWFILYNFWILQVSLGGLPCAQICQLLIASLLLAMAIPGAALLPRAQIVVGTTFVLHAAVICRLENVFYNLSPNEEGLYPSYLVVVTSAAGYLVARRLEQQQKLGPLGAWLGACLYLGKLPMLLVASEHVVWAGSLLMLAITPPILLYKERQKGGSRMKAWQGAFHVVTIAAAVWLCRYSLFDALLWWSGHRPAHALLLGVLLLFGLAACLPIVVLHFAHVQSVRRAMGLLAVTALLLVVLQPPVVVGGSWLWDERHMPDQEPDDAAIYGSTAHGPSWSTWLVLGAIVATLAASTSALPIGQVVFLRLLYAAGMGAAVGIFLSVQYFAAAPAAAHFLLLAASVLAAFFLVFAQKPTSWSVALQPVLFSLLVGLMPLLWLAVGMEERKGGEIDGGGWDYYKELAIKEARNSLLAMFCALFLLIALLVKLRLAALLREKHGGGANAKSGSLPNLSPFTPQHRNIVRRPSTLGKVFSVKQLAAEGAWMPVIGNISTLACFGLALYLNTTLSQSSDRAIFALAPILLLLNQDMHLSLGFTDVQRYFPLTLAISNYLIASVLWQVLSELWFNARMMGWELVRDHWHLLYIVKNGGLLLLTVPNHVLFNKFMWDFVRQSDYLLLLVSPLTLPAILLPDLETVRVAGVVALVFAVAQYALSRHVRIAGMKYI
eukprot:TRINITY_DN15034_c0_g1_i1.p1 TRINITY_DN15034_c0_g1~~TRINITY_DN15034_c0_g1_i1.p1  ORF type:complete len:1089 (-),score=216.57 TRINITY_DN15034_c0_g1_i1:498-3764(-)